MKLLYCMKIILRVFLCDNDDRGDVSKSDDDKDTNGDHSDGDGGSDIGFGDEPHHWARP